MIYKCLIVDDEALARKLLADYVQKTPELTLVGHCANAFEAKAILERTSIDILLLDIHMEGLSGLDLLKILKHPPATILTTAHTDYALQSYELDVVDYLLKPISFQRFYKAISKSIGLVRSFQEPLRDNVLPDIPSSKPYFFVKVDYKIVKVRYDDVLYIESMREYVQIYTTQQKLLALLTMTNLEQTLPQPNFLRIHRSFIINIHKIDSIQGNTVQIKDKKLPISQTYRDTFFNFIKKDGLL